MYEARIRETICIAHRVPSSVGEMGPLHGHNWTIELDIGASELDERGLVADLEVLRTHLHAVVDPLDHRTLGDLEPFRLGTSRSAPAVARWVAEMVAPLLDARLSIVCARVVDGTGGSSVWRPPRPSGQGETP